jgi:2-oxoglutarate dehydrogenase E1 component
MKDKFSYISNAHPQYIEGLYNSFKSNPESVEEEFRKFFEGFEFASTNFAAGDQGSFSSEEFKVYHLIQAYRELGHLLATTNPLRPRKDRGVRLDLAYFGLKEADLKKTFQVGTELKIGPATLEKIIDHLSKCYLGNVGFEYSFIRNDEELNWFKHKIEQNPNFVPASLEKKKRILKNLNKAVVFEEFLGKKFIGEKRFSLEGGESTIPALDTIIHAAAAQGVQQVVFGMAHRGRLNVLANIMGKTYEEIFSEFEGQYAKDTMGSGDVKYHKGFSSMYPLDSGREIYIQLSPNPSHLEAVNPVVEGMARAKADILYSSDYSKVLPILIHGDAAVAGQGIGQEVIQMAYLEGFTTGGTIHFIINNQIGFTTDFDDARSSDYSSAIAAIVQAPVIHVNGDDVEAVVYAAEMAAEYRQKFGKEIFIDMVCYRKHGHNESDDPKYTQPSMYSIISQKKNPRDIYGEKLTNTGQIEAALVKEMDKEFREELQARLDNVKQKEVAYKKRPHEAAWKQMKRATLKDFDKSPATGITEKLYQLVGEKIHALPKDIKVLKKVEKQMAEWRSKMMDQKILDWQGAELLAYGSLLAEGHSIRFTGEDVKRGTFTHRHACLFDENYDTEYCRLNHITPDQGKMFMYNSHLSEYGVLGYEFGYSLASPENLVIWEAQFGDFVNGAQIIIDQFILSSETKWSFNSGLVMLLPHGYEGQGPEHSSARMERFLQGCAENNIQVANITTPANLFHAMRRQMKRNFRIPLVVMSPKSLLRHPKCISPVGDVLKGEFQEVIDDSLAVANKVNRVLFCSGKIYYELLEKQEADKRNDIAIVRVEQLYPLPVKQIEAVFAKYKNASYHWVQEEASNMGSWMFLMHQSMEIWGELKWKYIGRKASASPATGYKKQHLKEQEAIIQASFNL